MIPHSRTVWLVALAAVLVVLAACTPSSGRGPSTSQSSEQTVTGRATAAPTCPVERNPPDPACAPRPVAGAVLVIQDSVTGREVTRVTTDSDGRFAITMAPGTYRLVPQPVSGLMGGGRPMDFQVSTGRATPALEVSYDTGIR
jgi:hypothetical protein